jgi:hypothetical protein
VHRPISERSVSPAPLLTNIKLGSCSSYASNGSRTVQHSVHGELHTRTSRRVLLGVSIVSAHPRIISACGGRSRSREIPAPYTVRGRLATAPHAVGGSPASASEKALLLTGERTQNEFTCCCNVVTREEDMRHFRWLATVDSVFNCFSGRRSTKAPGVHSLGANGSILPRFGDLNYGIVGAV